MLKDNRDKFLNLLISVITAALIFLVLVTCYGIAITILWNLALVPAITGFNAISVWQGLGISFLSSLLFKGPEIKKL